LGDILQGGVLRRIHGEHRGNEADAISDPSQQRVVPRRRRLAPPPQIEIETRGDEDRTVQGQ
jgi:hypothetical protein